MVEVVRATKFLCFVCWKDGDCLKNIRAVVNLWSLADEAFSGNFRNATPNSHFFLQNNNTAASVSSLGGATGQHVPMQASGATSAGGVSQMPYHPVLNPSNGSNTAGGPFPYHQGPLIAAAQGLYPTPVALTSVVGPPPTAHQQQNLSHSASQQLSLGQSANSSVSNVGSSAGATVSAQQQQTNSQQIPALTVAGGTPGVGVMANYFPHPGGHHNTVTVPSMYQSSIYNQQVSSDSAQTKSR